MLVLNTYPETTPVQTRDGRAARILGIVSHNCYPLVAAFKSNGYSNDESVGTYTMDGFKRWGKESNEDIANLGASYAAPPKDLVLDSACPCLTAVQTRDGRSARILCVNLKGKHRPIAAAVTCEDAFERVIYYYKDGRTDPNKRGGADLINVPAKI